MGPVGCAVALAFVGDCLADTSGALRFGAPGAARRNQGPASSCKADFCQLCRSQSRKFEPAANQEGTKARRKTHFLPNNSLPTPPHKVSYHITQHHQHQHHPQNFTHPPDPIPASSCSLLPSRHCIALQSNLTAQALHTIGTNRTGDSVLPTAVQAAGTLRPGTETQPLRPIAIPLRHQALPPGHNSPRDVPLSFHLYDRRLRLCHLEIAHKPSPCYCSFSKPSSLHRTLRQ